MLPSAASTMMGFVPHWSVISSNCCCMLSCGITFSIRVSMRYSGNSCLRESWTSTMCWRRDASAPRRLGGWSLIREWSLHGGAVDMMIHIPGIRCCLMVSASCAPSVCHTSPMCVLLMSNVCLKWWMQLSSVSHQKVCSTWVCNCFRASEAVPIPVKKERCITGGWLCKICCSRPRVLGWSAVGVAASSLLRCPYCFPLPWPLWPL